MSEKNEYKRLDEDFENYCPEGPEETIFWEGVDFPVPDRSVLGKRRIADYAYLNDSKTAIIINVIHKDFPKVYCQIQVVFNKNGEDVYYFRPGPREEVWPTELIERMYDSEIRPHYKRVYPQLFNGAGPNF